jgi:tripartite-type tricarboxylate transporter receptor subunit TctC
MSYFTLPGMNFARTLCLFAAALLFASGATAQEWPARPLRIVVPLAPGGQPDIVARVLASALSERLRQPVVIENRPGAQTNLGMEAVVRAAPDGHTFLFALTSLVINPQLQALAFDPMKELAPVSPVARTQFVLVISPTLPATSVSAFIAQGRSRPGSLTCAHAGGATQVACALFASLSRIELVLVPYRSNTLVLNDLTRGEVSMLFDGVVNSAPNVRAGRVRALAVTDSSLGSEPLERLPALAEALPGFELVSWQGLAAPAGTPAAIIRRMNEEIGTALAAPELRRRLTDLGVHPWHDTAVGFAAFLQREQARYGNVIREAKLRSE